MATGKALDGKPYAGNPHVRFDEGEVAPAATPRRGSLLYKRLLFITLAAAASAVFADGTVEPVKDGDTWTFTVADGTATYAGGLSGAITLVKEGAGTLDLGTTANTFTGDIEVRDGVLKGAYAALGGRGQETPPHERIMVANGATLAIVDTEGSGGTSPLATTLVVSGAGADGRGAVQRSGTNAGSRHGLFQNVTLNGDTTLGADARWGLGGPKGCALDMGGHRLTIRASAQMFEFYTVGTTVTNPGDIEVSEGTILMQAPLGCEAFGDSALRFADGTVMSLYGTDVTWPVVAAGTATVSVTKKDDKQNTLWEAVTFGSGLTWESKNAAFDDATKVSTLAGALDGPGTFRVKGPGIFSVTGGRSRTVGALAVTNATLALADAGTFAVTNRTVGSSGFTPNDAAALVQGDWANAARLTLTGASTFTMPASANGTAANAEKHHLMVGRDKDQFGVLEIGAGAVVSNDLNVGRYAGSIGAIYVDGGKLFWRGGSANQGWLGQAGAGYLAVNAGEFASEGFLTMGRAGVGIVRQRGGRVDMTAASALSLRLARESGSYALWHQTGGAFAGAHHAVLCHADALLNQRDVEAVLTVSGDGTSFALAAGKSVIAYVSSNAVTSVLSVRDGATLACAKMFKERMGLYGDTTATPNFSDETFRAATANAKFYVNFDGGVLKALNNGMFFQNNFGTYDDPDRVTVYAGGLTVDTAESATMGDVYWNVPIQKPSGNVLRTVSLPTDVAFKNKYVAPPRVVISGVNVHGATAVAELDEATGTLTGITVTSPGNDVPGDLTVTIASGDGKKTFACPFTVGAPAPSGGLVKRGAGLLRLTMLKDTPNTYEGATVVEGGSLEFDSDTYPAGSPLVLKGGEIRFGGGWERAVPSLGGYGTVTLTGSGFVTVTDELRLSCADLFGEGRTLTVGRLRVAEGARLVVTDPEKLSAYRDRDKTAFLTSTAKLEGPVPTLARDTATFGRWVCRKSADGKSLRFGPANGTLLVVR